MLSRSVILSLVLNGASACVPCLEAHRHSLAQSFGFDFGRDSFVDLDNRPDDLQVSHTITT